MKGSTVKYAFYDLHELDQGQIVEVELSVPANVRLMDTENFEKYKHGKVHKYHGGHVSTSPYRILVPRHDHWFVTIDLGGYAGALRHNVHVLWGALPEAPPEPGVANPNLMANLTPGQPLRECDIFIAYAEEDKERVVVPLARALTKRGYKVRYEGYDITKDTNLRRRMDEGLARSAVGIVLLSKDFLEKGRGMHDLRNLMSKKISGPQSLIPVWHNVTKQEMMEASSALADIPARNTALETIEEIADGVADMLR